MLRSFLRELHQPSWAGGDSALLTDGAILRAHWGRHWERERSLLHAEVVLVAWALDRFGELQLVPAARHAVIVQDAKPASWKLRPSRFPRLVRPAASSSSAGHYGDGHGKGPGCSCWVSAASKTTFTSSRVTLHLSGFLQGEGTARTGVLVNEVCHGTAEFIALPNVSLRWFYRKWCLLTSGEFEC